MKTPRLGSSPPPLWRDPWAWASLLALLPLVLHSLGAPLGEPVADDFDHLRYVLFSPHPTWLDGGGSHSFWRPLAYQGYFGLLARVFITTPVVVVLLHVTMLALAVLLLYRTALRFMPASWAAAAASFPILTESARALITVPVHFVDVGLLLFSALALHEAAASRLPGALLALLAALLCKESAVATALVLPCMPASGKGWRAGRGRWIVGAAAVTIGWGLVYLAVRSRNGLVLPRGLETGLGGLAATWLERCRWAATGTLRALFSLPTSNPRWEGPALLALVLLAVAAVVFIGRSAAARSRFAGIAPIVVSGLLWSAAATAPLVPIYPIWSPQRVVYSGIGAGVALSAALGAAHPVLLATLVALRLALFSLSSAAPARVTMLPPTTDSFIDFQKLTRLQRFMAETRRLLQSHFPSLPHGARVGLLHPPIMSAYAFGGDKALQVWYRDTTLRWLRYHEFREHPEWELSAIVEFEQAGHPQLVLVSPASMHHYLQAGVLVRQEAWHAAVDELAVAESLQTEHGARAYLGRIAGRRALCWIGLARPREAEGEARRGLELWPDGADARYTLASVMVFSRRWAQAQAQLDTLLKLYPGDRSGRALRDSLRSWAARKP